ncbi:MAG: toxin [Candidatus Methanoperedenaceae archaeon]|nr:MAG: toxin [Candidatus Methanoperedenaceae archaeon]
MPDKIHKPGNTEEASNNTATRDQQSSPIPSISLPKGGGAIRGIGEKFAANPVTGTGSLSVPIFTSPGRSGFGPQLSLSYDSGSGNGPFGFGWNLSFPSITRKTDKGLPKYQDSIDSDVFVLSGAEDLVPVFKKDQNGNWIRNAKENIDFDEEPREGYMVRRYRPRIEGLFARIERWTSDDGDVHWRSISKDNILTVYGRDEKSRIVDPEDKNRIISWLICESYDDKGNAIVYEYQNETNEGVDLSQANECNRLHTANRYLKSIKYGNRKPLLFDMTVPGFRGSHIVRTDFASADWMFEVVFDYDEGHYEDLPLDKTRSEAEQHLFVRVSASATGKWSCRPDPFSIYRAGFEVRSYRRCQRVLMFHSFPELGSEPCLVRSTEFDYSDLDYSSHAEVETELKHKGSTCFASFIRSVIQSGYVRDKNRPLTYLKKSLPRLEFDYSQATIQEKIEEIDAKSLENIPYGLDGARYQWVDLDGEGVSGILTEQAEAWFYKPNLGEGKFDAMETVATKPSHASLSGGSTQLLDLAGDGQLDVVAFDGTVPGFYERMQDQKWENFNPFASLPNISWKDPNLKFVDLTGDGHADVMITEDAVFTWYPSLAEEGFGTSEMVCQALDEEKGPCLVFDDGTQSIYLADFSGDGLSDLVRIRNGEVCYWPNLGYGRFGAKVTMDNAPWFDYPDMFDQKRIRLADIDGSGTTDIIYLGINGVSIYFNRSGNSWSTARKLVSFPHIDNLSSVQVADLKGNGTACLIWSSPLTLDSGRQMLYIDLMGGQKPHLLISSKNNMGAETVVNYAASTKFYLDDKAKGKPWITRIPFPVHVVESVEIHDHISQNLFVTSYIYHHGYFDGIEREFRGFGMVEQKDTEEFAVLSDSDEFPEATNIDKASHVPPVLTKTWFHTGAYLRGEEISRQFAHEYFGAPDPDDPEFETFLKTLLDDTVLPSVPITADETREACRSLKGSILRQEIYAEDSSPKAGIPYSVSERNYNMELLQPRGSNQHAVFFTHANETINYHYEQNIHDPRRQHELVLEVDDFGNVLKSAAVGYGRLKSDLPDSADQEKQTTTLITYTQNDVTNLIDAADAYRTPDVWQARTYELTGYSPGADRFIQNDFGRWQNNRFILDFDGETEYEKKPASGKQKRLIEHVRTKYRSNRLDGLLPWGEIESLALPGETYKLAFTPGLLTKVFGTRINDNMFAEGGYEHINGDVNRWIPSGRVFYDINADENDPAATAAAELTEACAHFFLPSKFTDPFGHSTIIEYDKPHYLLMVKTQDAVRNVVQAENDYRVLQPRLVTDPNENRSKVIFDALGMIAGTAVMGKETEPEGKPKGDSLDRFEPDLTQAQIDAFMAKPRERRAGNSESTATQIVHELLGKATSRIIYDIDRFKRTGEPPFAATITRETHASDLQAGQPSKLQISFSYSDGFGREIQKKIQAEPGPLVEDGPIKNPRWVGSGWTIFNNKGKPVRQYEPFFDNTHDFKFEKKVGVSSILFYDPVERVVATLHPNKTYEKVVFDPWYQETWDVNDIVLMDDPKEDPDVGDFFSRLQEDEYLPTWYDLRTNPDNEDKAAELWPERKDREAEKSAAIKTSVHASTPTVAYFDTLGRSFLTVAHNRFERRTNGSFVFIEEKYRTRVVLDIEGNQREVRDERKNKQGNPEQRIVMQYDYDMLGNRIHQSSMEAGERWMLNDVTGKPIRAWDSRGHNFRTEYDELRRPVRQFVRGTDAKCSDQRTLNTDVMFAKTDYGESRTDPETTNHRLKAWKTYDGAGIVVSERYDFNGNLLQGERKLLPKPYYKNQVNWALDPQPDETFISSTKYDALNRPIQIIAPHLTGGNINIIQPVYNEANLLECEDVWLGQDTGPEDLLPPDNASLHAVTNIDYNEKGQRVLIQYGNRAETRYRYDRETFRLIHLYTRRDLTFNKDCGGDGSYPPPLLSESPEKPPSGKECGLQNIHYTYDPVGNIIVIRDDAQQTIYFRNRCVKPESEYTYDAIYRLLHASGREHLGQVGAAPVPTSSTDVPRVNLDHPNDCKVMGYYLQDYIYDEVGNMREMVHHGTNSINPGWKRTFNYNELSLIEGGKTNNCLSYTEVNSATERYKHDEHGNMIRMPHLNHVDPEEPNMHWDFKDQLHIVDKSDSYKAYYVYDAAGQRVRKVIEDNGIPLEERIYLGGFEIYYKYSVTEPLVRETLHIMDDKQRIAMVDTRTSPTTQDHSTIQLIRYQLGNHLGSASVELDPEAQIISYEEYYPYGSTSYQGVLKDIEVPLKRYRYTGKERDEEMGLYYHGARYYAPWLGRWISADPNGLVDSITLFVYTKNNPLKFSDPSGTQSEELIPYKQRGQGWGKGGGAPQQGHFTPLKQVQRLYEGYSRELSEKSKELTLKVPSGEHTKIDKSIRDYLRSIEYVKGTPELLRIVKNIKQEWLRAGYSEEAINEMMHSAIETLQEGKKSGQIKLVEAMKTLIPPLPPTPGKPIAERDPKDSLEQFIPPELPSPLPGKPIAERDPRDSLEQLIPPEPPPPLPGKPIAEPNEGGGYVMRSEHAFDANMVGYSADSVAGFVHAGPHASPSGPGLNMAAPWEIEKVAKALGVSVGVVIAFVGVTRLIRMFPPLLPLQASPI